MVSSWRRIRSVGALLVSAAVLFSSAWLMPSAALARNTVPSWVAAWALPVNNAYSNSLQNQTIRVIARVSFGGSQVRIRVSNIYGAQPLTLQDAHVGIAGSGAAVRAGTNVPLTFGGSSSVTVPVGASVMSDPAALNVTALQNVAISLYAPGSTGQGTGNGELATYYVAGGDHASDTSGGSFGSGSAGGYFATELDVYAPNDGLIVAFGDSITVGYAANDEGWPYWLASRLQQLAAQGGPQYSIVDMGISGNQVVTDKSPWGVSAEHRLQQDVLSQTGLKAVLMMEGINDIGKSATPETLIENGYQQIITRVRAADAGILLSPLTPAGDSTQAAFPPTYSSPAAVQERHDLNNWIRQTGGAYSAGFDFEPVVKDPNSPDHLAPAYNSGDNLHPNVAGQQAMANSVNLSAIESLIGGAGGSPSSGGGGGSGCTSPLGSGCLPGSGTGSASPSLSAPVVVAPTSNAGIPASAPKLSSLRIKLGSFSGQPAFRSGSLRERTARISYVDSEPASTLFIVMAPRAGVKRGGKCVAAGRPSTKGTACVRYVVIHRFRRTDHLGVNRVRLAAILGPMRLEPGGYRLVVLPSFHGTKGRSVTLSFRLLP